MPQVDLQHLEHLVDPQHPVVLEHQMDLQQLHYLELLGVLVLQLPLPVHPVDLEQ
jgi:hypothetical protein